MSRLEELIAELCPDGVEYKTLGELGNFYGGLTGKAKSDFVNGNAKFITYRNVYSNPALDTNPVETVKIGENEKQNTLKKGDVVFTGSSETPDECGFSSVVTKEIVDKLYLNSFCFFFRFNNPNLILPDFAKHLFRSSELRYQIGRTASGVTRFNVSKDKMRKVRIPVPPLEVQREIVRILDNFTFLSAELSAELSARKKQYEYYRDYLLSNEKVDINIVPLREIATVLRGKRLTKSMLNDDARYPVFHGGLEPLGYYSEPNRKSNTVMVINVGASAGTVGFCKEPFWSSDGCYCLYPKEVILDRFLYYYLQFKEQELHNKVRHAGIPTLDAGIIENVPIPIPEIQVQKKIINILDYFDLICTDLSNGIPAEIEARQKQYEYYRDKLLTFKEKN